MFRSQSARAALAFIGDATPQAHDMPSMIQPGDPLLKHTTTLLTHYYECLIATNHTEDARKMSEKIITMNPAPSTYEGLIARANRVGNNSEVDRLTLQSSQAQPNP